MENNEIRNTDATQKGDERQIQLVVNRPESTEAGIDLGNIIRNMKLKKRVYAWLLVLCLVVGVCAPLVLYQFNRPMLTVSSVVVLQYEAPLPEDLEAVQKGQMKFEDVSYGPVTNLSTPNGEPLDLNQITSSFVLQTALDETHLSKHIQASALRSNITIQMLMTEQSSRIKESLSGLASVKNPDAYSQLKNAKIEYQNKFVVSLKNGFGDEDSTVKTELPDEELKLLLNHILDAYNDLLVRTYADFKLPEDAFSVIDTEELDILDSVDQLRAGITALYDYCNEKTDTVKQYRSWQTGRNLADWMETLQTFRSINVDYLYAKVSGDAVTRDKTSLLSNWKFQLRTAQKELDEVNESIAETKKILESYKNDEVFVSLQESDAAKTTHTATEYYNTLVLTQMENYDRSAKLKATIADYTDRIIAMEAAKETEVSEEIETELTESLTVARELYDGIRSHMEELFASPLYATFEHYSAAQGKQQSFLTACASQMLIGGVAGAVIAFILWFLAALAPELSKGRKANADEKEAA